MQTEEKLAQRLLEEHSHLKTFDVDPLDPTAADMLQKSAGSLWLQGGA